MELQVVEHNVRVEFLPLPKPVKPRSFLKGEPVIERESDRSTYAKLRRVSEFDLVRPTACDPTRGGGLDLSSEDQESRHMAQTTARPLTKYDYWELPEAGPRYQLINGDLFMAPAPNRFHQDISRTIQFEIMKYLEAEPVGILYDAPFDVVLTDIDVFQPDLAFFSERRRRFLTEKGAEGAPDLVVEILSPKTAHLDLDQKRLVYARTGVDELWVVDPEGEEVRVYLFREDTDLPKVILRSGDLLKTPRLPGFELSIQKIFKRF